MRFTVLCLCLSVSVQAQEIISSDDIPVDIRVFNNSPIPDAFNQWVAVKEIGFCPQINPTLSQELLFTPPSGWTVISVNEDQTLALMIPESDQYESYFDRGVLLPNVTITVYPVEERLAPITKDAQSIQINNSPEHGMVLLRGEAKVSRKSLPAILYGSDKVAFLPNYVGNDSFVFNACYNDSYWRTYRIPTSGTPSQNVEEFNGSVWRKEVSPNWTWTHNPDSHGVINVALNLLRGRGTVSRSISLPIKHPSWNMNVQECLDPVVPFDNQEIRFIGSSPFSVLPAEVRFVTDSQGNISAELPFYWSGNLFMDAQSCD